MASEQKIATPAVALVPKWDGTLDKTAGLFKLGDGETIPGAWEPKPDQYDPRAIPTPFARAEATRLVLENIDEAAQHPLAVRFQTLLMGVAAGVLSVEPDDLTHDRYDNLGQALLRVEPDARYFCQLRWRRSATLSRSFGVTHFASLFSPHARRADAEWDELAREIEPRETDALQLLLEWRAALDRAGRWQPPRATWQRGVDHVLARAGAVASRRTLAEDARLVGPVWLTLPTGLSDGSVREEPLYLPQLQPDWAARFLQTCQFRPAIGRSDEGEAIVFLDATQRRVAEIRLPPAREDTNAIAVGLGALVMPLGAAGAGGGEATVAPKVQAASPELWVVGHDGQPGLVELLRPVTLALGKLGRAVDAASVTGCPPLYPDPIRVLFERGLWPGGGAARVVLSRRATAALLDQDKGNKGRALDAATVEKEGGETVQLGGAGEAGALRVTLLDQLGELPVHDLRALGFVLWSLFAREAEVTSSLGDGAQLAMADTLERLLEHSAERPLEPTPWVYQRVAGAPPEPLSRRTATLQRFVRAYASPRSSTGGGGAIVAATDVGLRRVLDRAARSFARWATGARKEPAPLGRPTSRSAAYRLPTGEELRLPVDAVEI